MRRQKREIMPTKHIDTHTWAKVEKELVNAVLATKQGFKEAEIIKIIMNKGLENIEPEDYLNYMQKKNKK